MFGLNQLSLLEVFEHISVDGGTFSRPTEAAGPLCCVTAVQELHTNIYYLAGRS